MQRSRVLWRDRSQSENYVSLSLLTISLATEGSLFLPFFAKSRDYSATPCPAVPLTPFLRLYRMPHLCFVPAGRFVGGALGCSINFQNDRTKRYQHVDPLLTIFLRLLVYSFISRYRYGVARWRERRHRPANSRGCP